jgi:hypothetical protein
MSAATQEALFETGRHPMWDVPANPLLQRHRAAFRRELAVNLIRFDGRSDLNDVVMFAEHAYQLTCVADSTPGTTGAEWLVGAVTLLRVDTTLKLAGTKYGTGALNCEHINRECNIIANLTERLVYAVTKVCR